MFSRCAIRWDTLHNYAKKYIPTSYVSQILHDSLMVKFELPILFFLHLLVISTYQRNVQMNFYRRTEQGKPVFNKKVSSIYV